MTTEKKPLTYEQWKEAIGVKMENFTISKDLKRNIINSQRGLWTNEKEYVDTALVGAKLLERVKLCDVAFNEQYRLIAEKRKAAKFIKQHAKATASA